MNKIIILLVIIIIGFAVYFVFCKEEVEAPLPEDSSPGFDIPFTGVKVNDALCAPFLSFPDCSYASEQHQDLCKRCKDN
ncbi:hypothetical protein KAR26_01480 [Candidatus Parcubacteria bacterium]|nr:hypothetical protein [Candidatus Parcubacteria bacterium]MCK5268212.1 hypothetical protein [Spirochaetota bacterium]